MNETRTLKVAFLLGSESDSTQLCIEKVCALPNVEPVAALLDTEHASTKRRIKNLRNNVRKQGWGYIPRRVLKALRDLTDGLVDGAGASEDVVQQTLVTAFPERCFSIAEVGRKYGFELLQVGTLNSSEAVRILKATRADLGIVLGTRILKEHIFSVPRLGCINLHKGMVPNYRGMPPAFWELYDRVTTAGVTVHFVDKGLDTGDIVAASEVAIVLTDTPESLCQKLHEEGARALAAAVAAIQTGTVVRRKQERGDLKPRATPKFADVRELQRRLPHWRQRSDARVLAGNLYILFAYYSGLYFLARMWHRRLRARGCIFLYHRVNDFSKDLLTVDTRTFAAQLVAIAKRYRLISTSDLVNRIRRRDRITPTSVAVHFDDCYQDVVVNGMPILKALGCPATAFISSGFLDTDRSFAHDQEKYPFRYPNMQTDDVRVWAAAGYEIGAHTVNHVDLGKCGLEEATLEIMESRSQLEAIFNGNRNSGKQAIRVPIEFMSFPFGTRKNIRSEVVTIVREGGYSALFSAYGGFIGPKTDVYDIPRIGSSGESRPLYLLLEIEGLTPRQIVSAFKRICL